MWFQKDISDVMARRVVQRERQTHPISIWQMPVFRQCVVGLLPRHWRSKRDQSVGLLLVSQSGKASFQGPTVVPWLLIFANNVRRASSDQLPLNTMVRH
mmetsp:Transcript_15695/g.43285  ORF Transcript_15695/g.43285 Transcript_15695/m.43285 type:complete len:99 (-) Transcript_15695:990-1286(-)